MSSCGRAVDGGPGSAGPRARSTPCPRRRRTAIASAFAAALGVDAGPVARVLREATSPDRSFRALMTALGAPVPSHFGRHRSGPLDSDRTTVVRRHGILEAAVEETWGH